MGSERPKLTIAAEIATVATAIALGASWLYRHFNVLISWPLWVGKMNWLIAPLVLSFTANVLFSIGSRRQAKARRAAGSEYALSFHYAAHAEWLVTQLQDVWFHWHNAGECIMRPLDLSNEIKSQDGELIWKLAGELRDFQLRFFDHLSWIRQELPEFQSRILSEGYLLDTEYQDVLTDLRDHVGALKEKAIKSA